MIINDGLEVTRYRRVVREGNLIVSKEQERPEGINSILLPNKFDAHRAHLVIYNWSRKESAEIKVKPFLAEGESYRLTDPQNLFGLPVAESKYEGDPIHVPVKGEFEVFVLLKEIP